MKLPTKTLSTEFKNAEGSSVPEEFALEARKNPEVITEMAETVKEYKELEKEALARQYVLIIDKSGSMETADPGVDQGPTRWDSARRAVENFIDTIFKYDIDHTIPVYLFDTSPKFLGEVQKPGQVLKIFKEYKPGGTTNLADVLEEALEEYAGRKRPNYEVVPGTTFIVLLDGSADDEKAVFKVIQKYADPKNGYVSNHTQIAISFIQIGDDESATKFLQQLDDSIEPDICDTKKDDILREPNGLDRVLYDAIFD